jgi:glycosyltransferase involved in cell wall biosynthesis
MKTKRIALIIPAYNEELNIEKLVHSIHQIVCPESVEIYPIVINDGSKDKTGEIIKRIDCIDLHLPINLGIGAAVQTGLMYAYRNDFDYAIQVDGDGQHPVSCIVDFYLQMEKENLDVIIGSRYIENKGFQSTTTRRIGIKYFQWLNHLILGVKVTDSTSGLRMFNRKTIAILSQSYPDDYPEPEAIVIFKRNKLSFKERAVEMNERNGGTSSITFSHSFYYMIKVTLAIIFASIKKK